MIYQISCVFLDILSYVDVTKSSRDPKLDLLIALGAFLEPFSQLSSGNCLHSGGLLVVPTSLRDKKQPDTFFQGRRRQGRVMMKNKSEL